ncbi:glycosyl hydrolase family 18 protein [Hyphomicrobium sp. 99]|uniref:glycosyl hydrolase family 18 protein n=1 Tax=Hyphomicrobium sp. 99 TaxID=1163419 RepID=UPI0005F829EF|nr:glycosyl hydrolase family 18 protein [Hyphomicrobium sp. 99]
MIPDEEKAIFFDPAGRRARVVNRIIFICALAIAAASAVLAAGILIAPVLPQISLSQETKSASGAAEATPYSADNRYNAIGNRSLPEDAAAVKRFAFFSGRDPSSFISLQEHYDVIDAILPDWISLAAHGKGITRPWVSGETSVRQFREEKGIHLEIYPTLSTDLSLSETSAALANPENRHLIAASIDRYLADAKYEGVTIDLEQLGPENHTNLVLLLNEIGSLIRPKGRKIIYVMAARQPDSRDQELLRLADLVLVETYENSSDPDAGPPASQGWFEDELRMLQRNVDLRKLILGIGSYANDWDTLGRRRQISVQRAWELSDEAKSAPTFESNTLNLHFRYQTSDASEHSVWFLDGVTAFNQTRAALAIKPAGLALWRLGPCSRVADRRLGLADSSP